MLFHRTTTNASNALKNMGTTKRKYTSVEYIHYLVPDLLQITNSTFYWGKINRYEAETLLCNRPGGTYLLRDSTNKNYLFSLSFKKYGMFYHWQIERCNYLYNFVLEDPTLYTSSTICQLVEHYKFPNSMYCGPMLSKPLCRNFTPSLKHLCRATIDHRITYHDVDLLNLPKQLEMFLKEYHYTTQRVKVKHIWFWCIWKLKNNWITRWGKVSFQSAHSIIY